MSDGGCHIKVILNNYFDFLCKQDLTAEEAEALAAIRRKKRLMLAEHRAKKKTADNKPVVPRRHDIERQFNTSRMGRHLSSLGLDPTAAVNRARSKSATGTRSRKRDRSEGAGGDDMEVDEQAQKRMRSKTRSLSRPHKEALPGTVFLRTKARLIFSEIPSAWTFCL